MERAMGIEPKSEAWTLELARLKTLDPPICQWDWTSISDLTDELSYGRYSLQIAEECLTYQLRLDRTVRLEIPRQDVPGKR
jgi:hypothetical protein